MNLKDIEVLLNAFNNIKDVWFIILVPVMVTIIKVLNQNNLHQSQNIEKMKIIFKNLWLFVLITIAALVYLLMMISFSLSAYPTEEVSKYVSNWDNIGEFVIVIIIYAMLFPIILLPFLGEGSNRKYFIEIIHNNIVKREVVDRLLVNGKDKLILRDYEGFQTEKDVTEFSELKFEDKCKKSWVTIKDIENIALTLRNKSKPLKIIIFTLIVALPTVYLIWNILDLPKIFNKLEKSTDLFMYLGIFTLPMILTIELYYIAYITYKSLFKKN